LGLFGGKTFNDLAPFSKALPGAPLAMAPQLLFGEISGRMKFLHIDSLGSFLLQEMSV
jgi:hypothetical protein